MTAEEAAWIMMSGGGEPVIQPLSVTENGTYTVPEGVDGYNPVNVNVPDRYDDGYRDGYQDGYNHGCDDTRNEIENNPDDPTHKKIYDEGYADGAQSGGCTLPTGTTADDAIGFIGDSGTITDTKTGVSIVIEQYPYTGEIYTGTACGFDIYCGTIVKIMRNGVLLQYEPIVYTWRESNYKFNSFRLGDISSAENNKRLFYINYSSSNSMCLINFHHHHYFH